MCHRMMVDVRRGCDHHAQLRVIAAANVSAFVTGFTKQNVHLSLSGTQSPSPPTMEDRAECRSTWRESERDREVKSGRRCRTQKRTARERKDGTGKRDHKIGSISAVTQISPIQPSGNRSARRGSGSRVAVGRSVRDFQEREGGREGGRAVTHQGPLRDQSMTKEIAVKKS